jgi:hypothetical protein
MSKWAVIALGCAFCCAALAGSQTNPPLQHEQREFSAEDAAVNHPVALPADVEELLTRDERVRAVIENALPEIKRFPTRWFSASIVHLAGAREADLVVEGQGKLRGANVITFWVFRPTPRGHELILTAPAHDLIVEKKIQNGYKKLELVDMTAVIVHTAHWAFDGTQYKLIDEKRDGIK